MSDTHPTQVYALLKQLQDNTAGPEYLTQWKLWQTDKTDTVEPPKREPDYETWVDYLLEKGLAEYEEWCGGKALTITERGRRALILQEQKPERASNETATVPQSRPPASTSCDTMPWEDERGWDRPKGSKTLRILNLILCRSQVTRDELINAAWDRDDPGDNAIKAAIHKTNKYLQEQGHHQVLERVRDEPVIRWV